MRIVLIYAELMTLPITVTCGLNRAANMAVAHELLAQRNTTHLVAHCLDQLPVGLVSRSITDRKGQVDAALIELVHDCVSCTLREDVLPTLMRMAAEPGVDAIVLVLPEAVEPIGFLESFMLATDQNGRTTSDVCHVEAVVAVVDPPELVPTLSSDETLIDRGLNVGEEDDRCIADVLAGQVECADLVVAKDATAQERALLQLLNAQAIVTEQTPRNLEPMFDFDRTSARTSPAHIDHLATTCRVDDAWRLQWRSQRPLHPLRLYEALETIADVSLRGRGHFRIASRPEVVVEWDSVGGQLRLGAPATEVSSDQAQLQFVGLSDRAYAISDVLDAAQLTDAELAEPSIFTTEETDPFIHIWRSAGLEPEEDQ